MADATISREGLKAAHETTKQVLTLTTGIATLTLTFAEKFKTGASLSVPMTLYWSWGLYALATLFGLWTLFAIVGTHNALDQGRGSPDAMAWNIRYPALGMVLSFAAAFVLMLVAGASVV